MFEMIPWSHWLLGLAILVVAYVVRGITGFGSGLIAIPLLALMWPLAVVVPVVGLLDFIAAAGHGVRHRKAIQWPDLLPLMPFSIIGVVVALYLFRTVDAEVLRRWLGGFVILYALYVLSGAAPHQRHSRLWAAPAGSLGGLIGTLFGTGGPFYVIYLHLRALDKTAFRATVATIFLLDGSFRIIGYFFSGFYHLETLVLLGLGLPVMVAAMYVGGHIHTNLSQRTFQLAIAVTLLGSGSALLW